MSKKDLKKDYLDSKKIKVHININDFIDLINNKKLIISQYDIDLIKKEIKIKPKIKDFKISIVDFKFKESLKIILDSHLLEIQLC